MPIIRSEAPLDWPKDFPPTPPVSQRTDNGFAKDMTLNESIAYVEEELKGLNISRAALSLDIEQPLIDRLRKKVGSRTGACLKLKYGVKNYVVACDRWQKMEHNVYAIHLTLRQWRNMERWGIGSLDMLFAGFEAGRAGENNDDGTPEFVLEPWMEILGLGPTATLDDAVALYHRRAKLISHDNEQLAHLNVLMEAARLYFSSKS